MIDSKIVGVVGNSAGYPKLMQYIGTDVGAFIVIMTERGVGTVVNDPYETYYVGHHSNQWYMDKFTDFNGQVVLENKL